MSNALPEEKPEFVQMIEEKGRIERQALELCKPPFKFEKGYIWDSEGNMIADDGLLRVRGWARLGKAENGAQIQDTIGRLIAQAMNEFWERKTGNTHKMFL